MSSGNSMPNGVQQPLFAPVTQGNQLGEDIDLNEIFADYFISEFDDPLNAYTSSMANYSGAATAVALAQKQQEVNTAHPAPPPMAAPAPQVAPAASVMPPTVSVPITAPAPHPSYATQAPLPAATTTAAAAAPTATALPTGGIKTAFHTGGIAAATSVNTAAPHPADLEPAAKKLKESTMTHVAAPSYQQTLAPPAQPQPMHALPPQQVPQPATAAPVAAQVAPATRGGISGRLGFSLVGGQLAVPQKQPPAPQPQAVGSQQPSGMALPVGVGIRLGGVGGVAPSTAQGAVRQGTAHYAMWGGPTTGGAMSEQAVAERRQRNREHAKRSRVRKKFMLESLQEQVRALQKDNVELRMLIQQKLPQHAQKIISECCGKSPLFSDPNDPRGINGSTEQTNGTAAPADAATQASSRKETSLVRSDFTLIESLTSGQQNFVLSDPRLPDNPIVYASPGFFELTGYSQDQVLGRNCRFLQGPGTDPRAVDIIRTAIANGSDATTCLLNYKSDGTPFWNQFFVAALRDSDNCIVNYVGVQCEVEPEAGSSALEDKVNSVLPLQHKGENPEGAPGVGTIPGTGTDQTQPPQL